MEIGTTTIVYAMVFHKAPGTACPGTVLVDAEDIGDSAHRPPGACFGPDPLPQRQPGVQGGGCPEEEHVAADRAGVIVQYRGEPRAVGPVLSISGIADLLSTPDRNQRLGI